jgi:prephenate dehydrogenase
MTTVAIAGVGLIGGSLGMALRARGGYTVLGIGRSKHRLERARRRGALDAWSLDWTAARAADVIVLCMPVDRMQENLARAISVARPGAVITDAGSVKMPIVRAADRLLKGRGPRFVGAHPMAGSEKTGIEHACGDLYRGATVAITPGVSSSPRALRAVRALWKAAGGTIVRLTPRAHDEIVALTSHLPHLLAFALCESADRLFRRYPAARGMAAGSFADLTRVAGSDPALWSGICSLNRDAITRATIGFVRAVTVLKKKLDDRATLSRIFDDARRVRTRIVSARESHGE